MVVGFSASGTKLPETENSVGTLVTLYFEGSVDSDITLSNLYVSNNLGKEMQVTPPSPTHMPACVNLDNDNMCDINEIKGCMDYIACNYNQNANKSDDSCVFAGDCQHCSGATDGTGTVQGDGWWGCMIEHIEGCTSPTACNYNGVSTWNNGSCIFPTDNCESCSGECSISGIYTYHACINTVDSDGVSGIWENEKNGK